jgi:hypothetical protein
MPDLTHVHAVTTNQKNSPAPFRFELTKQTLSLLLGWDANGRGVEEIDTLLREGVGVNAFTKQVPHETGTDGVAYQFLPFTGKLDENTQPKVELLVNVCRKD